MTDETIILRPEVLAFAQLMELKLRANDHKPGWKDADPFVLFRMCEAEIRELSKELNVAWKSTYHSLREGETGVNPFSTHKLRYSDAAERAAAISNIPFEAADVANFAMMISDIAIRIATEESI